MMKIILGLFLILILFPLSPGFSQGSNLNTSALAVKLTSDSPYLYKDSDGYTVVVGTVENTNKIASVTKVRLLVNFYDDKNLQPVETNDGGTVLQVIPPLGKSPYMIKSKTPNPDITQTSVKLLGFDSSNSKLKQLSIKLTDVRLDETLHFSGILTNGGAPTKDAKIYLAFYDNFKPPRIIGVSTISIGEVGPNGMRNFNFDEKIEVRSAGFLLFSESNVSYSDPLDVTLPEPEGRTKLVTISDLSIFDSQGERLSEINTGSTVQIQSESWIQFSADQKSNETPYTFYVQIKQSGKIPYVEFLGKYDGNYIGADKQFPSVEWTPKNSGLFFIETFVWDRNNIPIADKGPIALVIVN